MNGWPECVAGADVVPGARLSDWTTFRLGGPCRRLVTCTDAESLVRADAALREAGCRYLLVGGGSNLLVSDEGVDRVVVRYAGSGAAPVRDGDGIEVDGAMSLDALSAWCAAQGLSGLGFAAGIPGTVGGAVAGNAGAFGIQMADRLAWAEILDGQGRRSRVGPSDLGFSYRRCAAAEAGRILLRFRFRVVPEEPGRLAGERCETLAFRKARHPDWRRLPCAGSFFRNVEPTSAAGRRQAAGWYLEQAGAQGMHEGGARVFERHCNIIVADGAAATALDVWRLAVRMAAAVRARFGLALVREVRLIGAFPKAPAYRDESDSP